MDYDTTTEVGTIVENATGMRLVRQAIDSVITDLLDVLDPEELSVARVVQHIIEKIKER